MGEDSYKNQTSVDKKLNGNGDLSCFTNSSTMSTCSEVDSESTNYLDDEIDMDYQYGPGIVSKLRTKFLSITLKQNRGVNNGMRRSCSLENLLDPKPSQRSNNFAQPNRFLVSDTSATNTVDSPWSNLKRAKSMDTLLLSLETSQTDGGRSSKEDVTNSEPKTTKEPRVIRRKDGPLTRSTISITEEEFPKPDIVKTYKRMFEPADSKKSSSGSYVRRRPPVLRATAKSGSSSNVKANSTAKSSLTNSKVNGVAKAPPSIIKSNSSAKELAVKDLVTKVKNMENQSKIVEDDRLAKDIMTQNKNIHNNNGDNAKVPETSDLIINGTVRAETIQLKVKEEVAKRNSRSSKLIEGNRVKPSVPLKKPSLFKNAARSTNAQTPNKVINKMSKDIPEKIKPIVSPIKVVPSKAWKKIENGINDATTEAPKPTQNGTVIHDEIIHDVCNEVEKKPMTNGVGKLEIAEPINKDPSTVTTISNGVDVNTKECKRTTVSASPTTNNTMVFDFRGKDVVSHLSISPTPFGCKAVVRKRGVIIDGKESMPYLNGFGSEVDSEDEEHVDYTVPPPCGIVFEGENIKVGKGSILATRNKNLKIHFDEDVEKNTFIYPSESSFLSDDCSSLSSSECSSLDSVSPEVTRVANGVSPGSTKLPANTTINSSGSGGLMSYTPSVLRTVENFQPGLFRAQEEKKKPEEAPQAEGEENCGRDQPEADPEEASMLKPADPEFISSWSLSAGTSDLLF